MLGVGHPRLPRKSRPGRIFTVPVIDPFKKRWFVGWSQLTEIEVMKTSSVFQNQTPLADVNDPSTVILL